METNWRWEQKIKQIKPDLDIRIWDGKDIKIPELFDLVFVDGPNGPENRKDAMRLAAEHGKFVIVHDGNTPIEKEHMNLCLAPQFDNPGKGGRRCYIWLPKARDGAEVGKPENVEIPQSKPYPETIVEAAPEPWFDTERLGEYQGIKISKPKFIKIVSTARGWGGCARSVTTIMKMLLALGHKVEFIPFRNKVSSNEFKAILQGELKDVIVTETYESVKEQCDILFMYADDYVWEFSQPFMCDTFNGIGADRKVMMVNYRRGPVGEVEWTKGWDKYMFLNSTQEVELLKYLPSVVTKVLPPCTDLRPFFNVKPDYNHSLRIVRHSSQGDTKFSKDFNAEVNSILASREDVKCIFLPGPSFLTSSSRCLKVPRTGSPEAIAQFLNQGNLFWYSLPEGYMDMGPRVILEAMAAGLPVVADNWGGARDRVTLETGWLCNTKEDHVQIIKGITVAALKTKGEAARARAAAEFVPERWIEEIMS